MIDNNSLCWTERAKPQHRLIVSKGVGGRRGSLGISASGLVDALGDVACEERKEWANSLPPRKRPLISS